jgi:drug/metabolite transporter (DMT)-like permease
MLVVVNLLWGLSFPWMKTWQEAARGWEGGELLGSLTLIALRMAVCVVLLALWRPGLFALPSRREHGLGALLGTVFFAGFTLQVWGLAHTTPALSAFFTSLGSAWVPLIAWALLRAPISPATWLGLGVGVAGTAVLVEGGWKLGAGEELTLAASVLFAGQVLLLDRLGRWLPSTHLTAGFFAVNAVLAALGSFALAAAGPGLEAWWYWTAAMLAEPGMVRNVLCLAVFSTFLSFLWMNEFQPQVSASRAALLYLLEPVFGAFFSLLWGYDRLTPALVFGGGLIVLGNAIAEVPGWLKERETRRPSGRSADE